jgi:hypothetical protein
MTATSRRLGLLLASTVAAGGMAVLSPALASAETTSAAASAGASVSSYEPHRRCEPAHNQGFWWKWRPHWHNGKPGGHWDRREYNHWKNKFEWKHTRDDRYCKARWWDRKDDRNDDDWDRWEKHS